MTKHWRTTSQVLFLLVFAILWRLGKMQMWMRLVLFSLALSLILGRFYCGWICPINTLMGAVEKLNKKLGRKVKPVPRWIQSSTVKAIVTIAAVGIMVLSFMKIIKVPLMLVLIPVAMLLSLFYHPALWHRYLCPYGILFSLPAIFAPLRIRVSSEKCSSCSLCTRVCPTETMTLAGKGETADLEPRHCLECLQCQDVCPKQAIRFSYK